MIRTLLAPPTLSIVHVRVLVTLFVFLFVHALDALGSGSTAAAQDITYVHIVRPGETLASIAQSYYGDPRRENVLVSENGLDDQGGLAIVEGLRLIIPTVRYHRVKAGDTWRDLAKRYYGDPDRSAVLLRANDAKPGSSPDEGAQLVIPYPARHVVRQGETPATISESYYGRREEVRLIKAFNGGAKGGRLAREHILLIPLFDLELSEEGRARVEATTGARVEGGDVRALQSAIDQKLPTLHNYLVQGRYAEALALGNQLLGSGQLTGNQEISIQRELAHAYVALGRLDLAAQAFERALDKQPDMELDSVRTSPRVLLALEQAKRARANRKPQPAPAPPN
jgi:LysM repeat protein